MYLNMLGKSYFFLFLDRWFAFVTVVSVLNAIKKALVLLEGLTQKERCVRDSNP